MTGKKSSKDYVTMYREIIKTARESEDLETEIGEIVILKYGIVAKTYKNSLSSGPARVFSAKDQEILHEMASVVSEYEEKLINYELPIAENMIYDYITSTSVDNKSYCKDNYLSDETVLALDDLGVFDILNSKNEQQSEIEDKSKMSVQLFEREKTIVCLYNKEMKTLLSNEQKLKKLYKDNMMVDQVKKIAELLICGISLENGKVRSFDLIDYYECTNVPPKTLDSNIRTKRALFADVDYVSLATVKNYLYSISKISFLENPVSRESKENDPFRYKPKNSENDELVVVPIEVKRALMDYLEKKGVPLTEGTYSAGLKRIIDGTANFELDEEPENRKVKVLK